MRPETLSPPRQEIGPPPWKNASVRPDSENSIPGGPRPILTRADAATLVGMVLCVASLFLVWKRQPVDTSLLRTYPPTLIRNVPPDFPVTGFGLPLHWPLTLCAVLCGAGLLITPKPAHRSRWAAIQITSAAVCLLLPVLRFAAQPGVITALLGGGLTLFGALERFGIGEPPRAPEDA